LDRVVASVGGEGDTHLDIPDIAGFLLGENMSDRHRSANVTNTGNDHVPDQYR
jgi:hypothetical protein